MNKIIQQPIYNADKTECLQIGYDLFNNQISIIPFLPTTKKVPSVLPKEITSLAQAFEDNENEFIDGIQHWDTSNITDMWGVFVGASNFNQDISMWNTSNVTSMNYMFSGCEEFNQDISKWDVSNVLDISYMFEYTNSFNQDISKMNFNKLMEWTGWCYYSYIEERLKYWPTKILEWQLLIN
ncbi:BspA family leucine-rich repeat surface protein [Mycoplasma capricolum]|uniref:PARCEL domain-containing protein n=1 Tax=Mycoplasma capricolum subsp. capricolum (strain California kid / ATCC 27343 / NCTC 10154) TaxID=340047 RepID=Q2SSG9_MYCCT|nr:BspA family leucine-rich repeat surface protein [Mycoplasma capricolum]ABC01502.1 conserved hypothetical protein [Mycoplasma capricolum subsp. capricolum ATCC 27343]